MTVRLCTDQFHVILRSVRHLKRVRRSATAAPPTAVQVILRARRPLFPLLYKSHVRDGDRRT